MERTESGNGIMEKWAAKELSGVDLGDVRRNKRLIKIVEDLAAQPDSSVPQASGNMAATKAAYNFWKSPYFPARKFSPIRDSSGDNRGLRSRYI